MSNRIINKASVERVAPRQSAAMNILHKVNKLSIRQIHEKFSNFCLSTVFRHATRTSENLSEKKKRSGRPRIVTDRDERKLVRALKRLSRSRIDTPLEQNSPSDFEQARI